VSYGYKGKRLLTHLLVDKTSVLSALTTTKAPKDEAIEIEKLLHKISATLKDLFGREWQKVRQQLVTQFMFSCWLLL